MSRGRKLEAYYLRLVDKQAYLPNFNSLMKFDNTRGRWKQDFTFSVRTELLIS